MLSREELKKLERKAKTLMLNKEIPQGKVEVVRSILSNNLLLEEERFNAIIELLKNCPNKPEERFGRRVDLPDKKKSVELSNETLFGPARDSSMIKTLYDKRRKNGLFKIRYLAPSTNRLGITFKKRLIPTKKLLNLMREVRLAQDRISVKLPTVLQLIIDDPTIEDPTLYNYIKHVQNWLMECPLASLSLEQVKWMDRTNFEAEIKIWCVKVFSFFEIETSAKEAIINIIDGKLRETEDLRKEEFFSEDSDSERSGKEKRNLAREKTVYDIVMALRSFLPSIEPAEGSFSKVMNTRYGIQSLRDLSHLLLECLVYGREVTAAEINKYYGVFPPLVSSTEWNAGIDSIRRAGKDPESRNLRFIEHLHNQLYEYEELFSLLSMRYDTVDYVRKAFDEQWRVINKRKQDGSDIYERDFLTFLDECLCYFITVYAPFIDGSRISLSDHDGKKSEASIFGEDFFQSEMTVIMNIQKEIFTRRSSTTNNTVTRAEARRIVLGQIPSMKDLENLLRQMSSSFYSIGKVMQQVLARHREALQSGVSVESRREPLKHIDFEVNDESRFVVPYYDHRFAASEKQNPAQKMLVGTRIVNSLVKEGILNSIVAFCFQFAQECFDRSLNNDLDFRKDLLKKIDEAERK